MKLQKTAGIEYLDFPVANPDLTVVMLHGYGADAYDLSGLAGEFTTKRKIRYIFLNAPQTVIIDTHMTGRAWFAIDILELSLVMQRGNFEQFTQAIPKGLEHVREMVLGFIDASGLDISKTVFGGFSQGAMVATDVVLHLNEMPKGLLLFSSSLVNEKEWKQLLPQKKGLPFFQSHGQNDPLLRVEIAMRLENLLRGNGLKGKLQLFSGAHEIPYPVIESAEKFLDTV